MDSTCARACVHFSGAFGVLLCPANRIVHSRVRRDLADASWAFRGLQVDHFGRHRRCVGPGMGELDPASETVRQAEESRSHPRNRLLSPVLGSRNSSALGTGRNARDVDILGGETMKDRLLQIGIIGSIIAAICCFTPVLVVLLGAIGLSALIGYLDIVLLPALAIFLVITGYALWKRSRTQ